MSDWQPTGVVHLVDGVRYEQQVHVRCDYEWHERWCPMVDDERWHPIDDDEATT